MRQVQQGDVVFQEVYDIPAGGKIHSRTVAIGEQTNHHHTLEATDGLEVRDVGGVLYARIVEPTALTHQEHHALTIPPGTYRIGRVLEYDHFAEEARSVVD